MQRGLPSTIYSDNGTNFKGADRYLNLHDDAISRYATEKSIEWKFNTPYTPHRGGIWESDVKSAKRFLPPITKDQKFTATERRILLEEIECILNSRPLAYAKSEDSMDEVVTPGHFLIGRNLTVLPENLSPSTNAVKLSTQYKANCQRIRDFWKVWSVDYINQLRSRAKWLRPQPNIDIDQIVLFKGT